MSPGHQLCDQNDQLNKIDFMHTMHDGHCPLDKVLQTNKSCFFLLKKRSIF